MRQWRRRVARVRQQPETFSASLNPRIAASDPLFVGGTSARVVNSHTWLALRLRRRARTRPGWLPLGQGRDMLIEIPQLTAWSYFLRALAISLVSIAAPLRRETLTVWIASRGASAAWMLHAWTSGSMSVTSCRWRRMWL